MFHKLCTQFWLNSAAADESTYITIQKKLISFSGKLMTYTIGLRFLTDFLQGDTYFRVHRPRHNLDRSRTQIKLAQSIERQEEKMQADVASLG